MPDGAVVISDPNLIFHGEFKRTGLDLVLSHDGHDVVVHDYFRGDKRAAIASPDGAHLTGDIVSALTGYVQVAQAAPGAAAAQVIGHVTKLTGSATVVRNGVSVILNNGDNVEKGDVVSTGSDSTLGITFIDGTVFGLSSNARMVLNEMVYDPNGSNNSSLLSLVAGTITFVAGETAKHGDMKIDTPVATMGIRGTAVLTEINFVVPAGGGDPQPQANFQVLVEPNGTTGSYILFDKLTLLPIATVNQAGQMIQISGGNVSVTSALLSPDVQKLITDVFTLKFTDNNTNTKLTTNFTDTITQDGNIVLIKSPDGSTATATFTPTVNGSAGGPAQGGGDKGVDRIPGAPFASVLDANGNVVTAFNVTEHANATGDRADTTGDTVPADIITFRVNFVDQNLGDRPTVSVDVDPSKYTYTDSGHHDVTASLTALQKQDIAATQIKISVVPDGGNTNNGSAILTYTIPDHAFDFLADGETLTLTYIVSIDNNFSVNPETRQIPITITITGSNDKPVITTSVPTINFSGGTSVPGGPLTTNVPTTGTLTFRDVDLTDTHTVSVALTSASLPDGTTVPPGPLAAFQHAMSVAIANGFDSTGTGTGTINWSLADLPVYLADFIPKGEVLTLVYTVTVADEHHATSQQTITVTITGTDAPAVVWIATDQPSGGFWKDAANWETGTVPTSNDDVIVITDQLHGLTPSYPVTIDVAAFGKSLTMDDYDTTVLHTAPQVINHGTLTLGGKLTLNADAKFTNAADGTVFVGGAIDVETITRPTTGVVVTNTVTIANAGTLTLAAGGVIDTLTTIVNSGTINLSGGTLTLDTGIANAGGTLQVGSLAMLVANAVTIDGGTVKVSGTLELDGTNLIENGTLNNSGVVNVKGAVEFAGETVANNAGGLIEIFANDTLSVDQGSHVNNFGNVRVDASSKLIVNGATIDGGAIVILPGTPVVIEDDGHGTDDTIFVTTGPTVGTITNNSEIDLTGHAVLSDGILKNNGVLYASGAGNALNGESVTNAGTIEVLTGALAIGPGSTVDNSSGNIIVDAALTLDRATLSGGAIKGGGSIDVTGASKIDKGATLTVATVTADAKLTLDGVTVSGSVITDNASIELGDTVKLQGGTKIQGGPVTNNGTLEIAGAATLLDDIVTNIGTVQVDDGKVLTLSGTEITGGTVNIYSGLSGGTIAVAGDSTIDGNATLNKGAVTVASDVTLILDDVTVSASKIADSGTVKVETDKKLTLAGATLTGGALTVAGTLASSGTTTVTDANISNFYLLESTLGGLLTLAATSSTPVIANDGGTIRANNAELDINAEAVTNTGTLAAINDGTLKLISTDVTNTGGAVSIESGSTLDLSTATIDGGTVTIAGTLESTGTSGITNADITNTGTISVTSGTLTIDPAVVHTLTNHKLIQANGGELDISGEQIVNTADIKAIGGGILKLASLTVTNDGGTVTVDGTSKLYLTAASINGGSLNNLGNLYGVSGLNAISAGITNTGIIEVQAGTLNLSGGLAGAGSLVIDDGATLELAGATAQIVTFAGGADTLQLDKVVGQSFTGTITGQSSTGGTFTVTGAADITTSSNDALDFTAAGGTSLKPANIVLTPTGTLKGAANGIVVTQNGTGNISLTATKDITGLAGNGITLRDSATGVGDITINNLTGKATGTGANSEGILAENLNAANAGNISITQLGGAVGGAYGIDATTHGNGDVSIDAGGAITGSSIYAIRARSYGTGDITVTTEAGSVVSSGSSGIVAVNRATSLDASNDSTITVNAYGTINSGSNLNQSGNTPAGIQAGYTGATTGSAANTDVNGSVIINNYANITSGGHGIHAYNYGNGDVTVNDGAGTTVTGAVAGIKASAVGGGTGDVTINVGANAHVTATSGYGIDAYSLNAGNISVVMSDGDVLNSGSVGIDAVNEATAIGSDAHSTIFVSAHGTIHSGTNNTPSNHAPAGIMAGYTGGGSNFDSAVHGDVTVESDATIIADAGSGIAAFNQGVGKVTVTTGEESSITAAGTAINVFDLGGGDINVTNGGSATGATGLTAFGNGAGNITIANDGHITGTSGVGIGVTQAFNATGQVHITNDADGHVTGADGMAAISVQAGSSATVLIDNSGTIGPDGAGSVTSTTSAIVETGGPVTINNTGDINGNISVATATFNNEAAGTWTVSGTSVFGTLSKIDNAGEIDLHDGASVSSADGVAFDITNSGKIESWGTTSITGHISNTNTIEIHTDGTLSLFGSLSGSGSVTIDTGATLVVDAAVSQTVTFGGTGAELDIHTTDFGGSIAGLAATDKIDLSSIDYGPGTSAVYVANHDASTGGTLTITDAEGHHISLVLTGADYSNAVFAGSDDGTGHTLITVNAADDAPKFTADGATTAASFSELADTTGASTTHDPSPAATGSIAFTDVDLTDRPTATVTHQDVTWLDSDHAALTLTPDEISALEDALSLQLAGKNNGTVGWSYSIADSTLDFLGQGQTATVVSTITLDDGHKTDTTQVTVTITGANDAPVIAAKSGDSAGADMSETNSGLSASGTLTVSDADATDHVTVALDHVSVYLDGILQTDGIDGLSNADLLNYLTVQSGDILNGTATHAQFSWDFNSGSQAFDFLAAGHTLSLQYTMVPDDGHAPTGAGNAVVTINIAGSNDAPTLDAATLGPVVGNDTDPAGSSVSDLFTGKLHDVDDGASFKAIAVTSDTAPSTEGVWQYELAGTNQWVDIGSVCDTHALVLGTDTLIRFLPADGFTGTPAALGVHALDNTYTGGITTTALPATIDITAMSTDGTAPVSDKAATISTSVTAPPGGPVIDTENFYVSHDGEAGTDTIFNLSVSDTASGASADDFTVTASTLHAPGSSVDLSPASGSLDDINTAFENGVTYNAGEIPPDTDRITLTVTDKTTGAHDTVNFIFDEAGDTSQGITLTGTSGKDIIFAPTTGDTLTGGGGKDQFVFAPGWTGDTATHTITDFIEGLDRIDLRQFSDVSSIHNLVITQQNGDTLVSWHQQIGQSEGSVTEHEQLLLKNVTATLKASDFIFHIT